MAPFPKVDVESLPWGDFEVLSLDIFDTTLARLSGPPASVFELLESRLVVDYGEQFSGFSKRRAEIDSAARRKAWEERQVEEITLDDIYACLGESWAPAQGLENKLQALEEELEGQVLYGLEQTRQLISAARTRHKKVIFVSDMYLSETFIAQQLERCGFSDYDHLFVSSTEGCLKWSGRLYKTVEERLQLRSTQFFHIGDNAEVDGKKAQEAGWQSRVLTKSEISKLGIHPLAQPLEPSAAPSDHLIQTALLSRHFDPLPQEQNDSFWFGFGFEYAAPLYFGFLRFILKQVKGRGLESVYFLSRDGYFLKELYDTLTKGNSAYPESKYLYASRRGLKFPAIEKIDAATEDWLAEGINLSVGDFFERMGMDPGAFTEHIGRYGFSDHNQIVRSGFDYDALRRLFHEIEPAIIAAAKEERGHYLDYLRGVLGKEEPFVMVDVGWNASLQKALKNLFRLGGIERPLEGLYLGTYEGAEPSASIDSTLASYLVNYGQPAEHLRLIRYGVALIEFLFAAPETTFLRMQRNKDGKISPLLHGLHENAEDLSSLSDLHDGVRAFFNRIGGLAEAPGLDPRAETVVKITDRWLAHPSYEEAIELSKVAYPDGWGGVFHQSKMADTKGFWSRALSPKKAKSHFKSSHWRPGYDALLSPLQRAILRLWHPAMRMDREV
jgi:HAD superfamily hydrolase (TIGR01549 family)|tara:strand:+ start:2511 stop:4517 length:2007 start_codon:yes stop_codon:yes gene_type:complete